MTQPPGPDEQPPAPHGGTPTFGPPGRHARGYQPAQPPPGYHPSGAAYYGPPPDYPPPYPSFDAPRPGCVPLRPLGLSDILDGAFRAVRRNPKAILGLSAVVATVEAVIGAVALMVALRTVHHELHVLATGGAGTGTSFSADPIQLLSNVLSIFMSAVLSGLLTIVVTQDVLGRQVTIAQAWAYARPRMWRLLGVAFTTSIVSLIGLVLCLAPGVWLWGIWAVAIPACMVEKLGVGASLGRSQDLVDGTFWRVWGIRALGALITMVAAWIILLPFVIGGLVPLWDNFDDRGARLLFVILFGVGSLISRTFTAPIRAGIDALIYVDLRMRKEGMDIALRQASAAPAGPLAAY